MVPTAEVGVEVWHACFGMCMPGRCDQPVTTPVWLPCERRLERKAMQAAQSAQVMALLLFGESSSNSIFVTTLLLLRNKPPQQPAQPSTLTGEGERTIMEQQRIFKPDHTYTGGGASGERLMLLLEENTLLRHENDLMVSQQANLEAELTRLQSQIEEKAIEAVAAVQVRVCVPVCPPDNSDEAQPLDLTRQMNGFGFTAHTSATCPFPPTYLAPVWLQEGAATAARSIEAQQWAAQQQDKAAALAQAAHGEVVSLQARLEKSIAKARAEHARANGAEAELQVCMCADDDGVIPTSSRLIRAGKL